MKSARPSGSRIDPLRRLDGRRAGKDHGRLRRVPPRQQGGAPLEQLVGTLRIRHRATRGFAVGTRRPHEVRPPPPRDRRSPAPRRRPPRAAGGATRAGAHHRPHERAGARHDPRLDAIRREETCDVRARESVLVGRDDAGHRLEERPDVRRQERRLVGVVEARHRRAGPVERAVAVGMDPGPRLGLGRRIGRADRGREREALAPVRPVAGPFVGDAIGRPGQPERGRGRDDPPAHLLVQRDLRERERGVQRAEQPCRVVGVAECADRRPQPEPAKVTRWHGVQRVERGGDERPGGRDSPRFRHVAGDGPAGRVERRR